MGYNLGMYLRDIRKAKGFSLKKVEEEIEVSASYINRLEKGNRQNPSIYVLEKLSNFYGLDPKEIMKLAGYNVRNKTADIAEEIIDLLQDIDLDKAIDILVKVKQIKIERENKNRTTA